VSISEYQEVEEYLDGLSVEELEALYRELIGYEVKPVSITEFIHSEKFLGNYFQGNIFPYWESVLERIYPSPFFSPYWLIALRGAIGIGKTTIACTGIAYDTYLLLTMQSPQRNFKLIPSTRILFAIFNVTLALSQDVVWNVLTQMFTTSPFFSALMPDMSRKKRDRDTLFPKNIDFFMGSRIGHTLGRNVMCAILDESNFEILHGQVYKTFNSLLRRMESRFMQIGGGRAGKIWVVSSEADKSSTLNRIVDSYRGKDNVLVCQPTLWDVKPERYGKERFWVFVGSDTQPPCILDAEPLNKEDPDYLAVPLEHRASFEADIGAALRDLAGRSVVSNYRLFRLYEKVHNAAIVGNLFSIDECQLDFDDETDQLMNYVGNYFSSPIHKSYPRFIHIDIGLSGDRLGLAAAFISEFRKSVVTDITTFENVEESLPVVTVEWVIGISPKPGKQIPLYKIRAFINYLLKHNYPIAKVSADGFNSADMLQLLSKIGLDTTLTSVDRTSEPYLALRDGVYENRIQLPHNQLLLKELLELEITADGSKVDHPQINGSKDLADAVCGAVYNALLGAERMRLLFWVDKKEEHVPKFDFKELFWKS